MTKNPLFWLLLGGAAYAGLLVALGTAVEVSYGAKMILIVPCVVATLLLSHRYAGDPTER